MSGGIGIVRRTARPWQEPSAKEPSSDAGLAIHRCGRIVCH